MLIPRPNLKIRWYEPESNPDSPLVHNPEQDQSSMGLEGIRAFSQNLDSTSQSNNPAKPNPNNHPASDLRSALATLETQNETANLNQPTSKTQPEQSTEIERQNRSFELPGFLEPILSFFRNLFRTDMREYSDGSGIMRNNSNEMVFLTSRNNGLSGPDQNFLKRGNSDLTNYYLKFTQSQLPSSQFTSGQRGDISWSASLASRFADPRYILNVLNSQKESKHSVNGLVEGKNFRFFQNPGTVYFYLSGDPNKPDDSTIIDQLLKNLEATARPKRQELDNLAGLLRQFYTDYPNLPDSSVPPDSPQAQQYQQTRDRFEKMRNGNIPYTLSGQNYNILEITQRFTILNKYFGAPHNDLELPEWVTKYLISDKMGSEFEAFRNTLTSLKEYSQKASGQEKIIGFDEGQIFEVPIGSF